MSNVVPFYETLGKPVEDNRTEFQKNFIHNFIERNADIEEFEETEEYYSVLEFKDKVILGKASDCPDKKGLIEKTIIEQTIKDFGDFFRCTECSIPDDSYTLRADHYYICKKDWGCNSTESKWEEDEREYEESIYDRLKESND